jgi:Cdc6-like AAA superfamily ATPase
MSLTDPPVYRPDLFVNRENEIKAVTNALQNIARGDSEQMRTIVFRGERGLGKSWLALHLHRSVLKDEALPNYRIVSASSRDIFGCSKNRQNRIVENSTYPLDDFGFR